MARGVIHPTKDEHGDESHPAWVMIGANRVSHAGGPNGGAVLFDSDIVHNHYVVIKLCRATRQRNLNRDWKHARQQIIEVALSEAQWASFVSSMGQGSGVPATLLWDLTLDDPLVPDMPFQPRLQESMDEVHNAAVAAQAAVKAAFDAYAEKRTAGNLRSLEFAIANMPANIEYAAKSLSEHAENVVQRAKVDIEAFVVDKAAQLAIEPSDISVLPELNVGSES